MTELQPNERLKQELISLAKTAADRALEFQNAANASGDIGCRLLADINFDDALINAHHAGELDSTNDSRKDDNDPVYVSLRRLAFSWRQLAIASVGTDESKNYRDEALKQAYLAGMYVGNGSPSEVRPTFEELNIEDNL